MSQKSDSSPEMADQGMWHGRDEDLSKTVSSISSLGKATSSSKDGNAGQEPVAKQGAHYPPTTSGGYVYPGHDRDHPKMEVKGNFISQGRTEEPYSVSQPTSIQPLGAVRHGNNSEEMSSLSYKGQGGPRNSLANSRSTGQYINNTNQLKKYEKDKLSNNLAVSRELVRGPRANKMGISSSSCAGKDNVNYFIRRDQYNKSDFQIKYEQAKFFMIKSYSEDDVHKSIKYNVWSSTAYGNKKLEAAFRDAEMQTKDKSTKCPIFLFFSVNTSGQFVGLAEMIAPVDFTKNMEFWQRDKWNGFFPVTWHIIKDIPNNLFHNITLENNDNRAVTFSRDTQEIGFPQGLKMLHIFKGYTSETSLLDDFDFYERREKSLRATRSSRPVKAHSELEFNAGGFPMKHLESAVRKMSVSARTGRPSVFRSSPTAHSRRSSHKNHLEAKRYHDAS